FYEGFGLPPLEAMACGTPVICSNSSSLPEVVGEAGVLVDPHRPELFAEAMERVLTDGGLREDLGSKGSHRSRRFSSEDFSGRLLEILEELASSRGP
ncbi:MAG: glycosyltransferase family 1 protein, partial [Candidatus Latescibacterota bacterium]